MGRQSNIRNVFAHFQNLNLLALVEDLRQERTTKSRWASGSRLCPIAHGLPGGRQVLEVSLREQSDGLRRSSDYAAALIGAPPKLILNFIELWDDDAVSAEALLGQLEAVWEERLQDAEAVQAVLQPMNEPTAK